MMPRYAVGGDFPPGLGSNDLMSIAECRAFEQRCTALGGNWITAMGAICGLCFPRAGFFVKHGNDNRYDGSSPGDD
jgi:hypothetical protein